MLRGVGWPFLTGVSRQPIGPFFKSGEIPIMQRIVVIPYRRFGTTYRSRLQESRNPYYVAYSGDSLPAFRDNLSGPFFKSQEIRITQRIVVIPYRRSGTTYRSHIQESRNPHYAAYSGNSLQTFRDNLSVPSSRETP